MKKELLLICLAWISFCLPVFSQNCEQKFKDAEAAERRGDYLDALRKFNAARKCDASLDAKCEGKIEAMFKKIDGLRKEAEDAKNIAKEALVQVKAEQDKTKYALAQTEKAKIETDSALQKAQKLINALYFYDDKFALACGDNGFLQYYFIDKNGNKISKLGNWAKATQFERTGFAIVEEIGFLEKKYLLDTVGNRYSLTSTVERINSDSKVAWLSDKKLERLIIPNETEIQKHERIIKESNEAIAKAMYVAMETGEWLFKGDLYTGYYYEQILNPLKSGLQWIDISKNSFKNIPDDVIKSINVKILNASNNKIEAIDDIWKLTSICLLDLSHNQIKIVPPPISPLPTLHTLDIGSNQLSYLPVEIKHLENLVKVDLSSNQFEEFPSSLSGLKKLKSLELTGNKIKRISRGIGELQSLTSLNLGGNKLESLPDEIGLLKNLTWLNLIANPIPEAEQERIRRLLPWCEIEFD